MARQVKLARNMALMEHEMRVKPIGSANREFVAKFHRIQQAERYAASVQRQQPPA